MQTFKVDPAALERLMEELEKEYEAEHSDPENLKKLDELCSKISDLIGKRNWHYFREYTDRLLAQSNKDVDWFFKKGFETGANFPPN